MWMVQIIFEIISLHLEISSFLENCLYKPFAPSCKTSLIEFRRLIFKCRIFYAKTYGEYAFFDAHHGSFSTYV